MVVLEKGLPYFSFLIFELIHLKICFRIRLSASAESPLRPITVKLQ